MKVSVSAYACEPGQKSEPGVGWNWVRQITRCADKVWGFTRANNRDVSERALHQEPLPDTNCVYFAPPRWARFWKKGERGVHFYYYLWQVGIYFLAHRLHREVEFDLLHHVTFVNYWMPSFLTLLPVPVVWGPVGGGESAPRPFLRSFSWRGRLYEYARSITRWFGEHDPFVRMTARKAAITLATTPETAKRVENLGASRVEIVSQVALPAQEIRRLAALPVHSGNPFRLLSLGRLLHWKDYHLGLMAFAVFVKELPQSEYWIVGDGPESANLQQLLQELCVADKVQFFGALPRSVAVEKLAEWDVLVHPSLHESGDWVCGEAMAAGSPVISLDLGGPALQVTEETSLEIMARMPEQSVADMAEAMLQLARDSELRPRMGSAGRRRVRDEFTWERRGAQVRNLYVKVVVR